MKKAFIILAALLVIIAASFFYFSYVQSDQKNNLLLAVPADASIVFELEDPFVTWKSVANNTIWNYLKTNPYFEELGHDIDSLTLEMQDNQMLYDLLIGRPIAISLHKTRIDDFDFLYVVDLQSATKFKFLTNYLEALSDDIERVYTRKYREYEIIEFSFSDSPTTYYFSIYENLLSISSTHTILERAIAQRQEPIIIRDLDYLDVSNELGINDVNMYLNYNALADFFSIWVDNKSEISKYLMALKYSAVSLEASDESFSSKGYSSLDKGNPSLLNALISAGHGDVNVGTIVPSNASYFMSLGFVSPVDFYAAMQHVIAVQEKDDIYSNSREKIEDYLNLSIEDDFLSWMDNEIALIQLKSSSDHSDLELAVAIKHTEIDYTLERLNYIKNQIKKKTPVKFKGIHYKGHDIHFLSIKGFFKIIFGKAFDGFEKPYYTVMDEYVVFSNSPRTIGRIITAVEEGTTLDHTKEYALFMENFEHQSNLFVYLSSKELLSDAKRLLSESSWGALKIHRPYFESFPMIGIQLSGKNDLLKHKTHFTYLNSEQVENWNNLVQEGSADDEGVVDTTIIEEENIIDINGILPEDLNSDSFIDYYDDNTVRFEVSLKNGLKHGRYFEYDSMGNMIVKGRYRNNQKSGTWRYYDENGALVKKSKF